MRWRVVSAVVMVVVEEAPHTTHHIARPTYAARTNYTHSYTPTTRELPHLYVGRIVEPPRPPIITFDAVAIFMAVAVTEPIVTDGTSPIVTRLIRYLCGEPQQPTDLPPLRSAHQRLVAVVRSVMVTMVDTWGAAAEVEIESAGDQRPDLLAVAVTALPAWKREGRGTREVVVTSVIVSMVSTVLMLLVVERAFRFPHLAVACAPCLAS